MRRIALFVLPTLLVTLAGCGDGGPNPSSARPMGDGAELTMQPMPGPVDPNAPLPPGHPPVAGGGSMGSGGAPPLPEGATEMPAGHPPVAGGGMPGMGGGAGSAGPAPVTWKVPDGWVQTRPSSSMRIAQFVVAEYEGAAVECKVFGGIGGTADQNVQRWIGQFSAGEGGVAPAEVAEVSDMDVNGLKIKRLDLTGTFGGGMMAGGAAPGADEPWRMVACTVDGAGAPVQILLVGPADLIADHVERFDALVKSLAPAPR